MATQTAHLKVARKSPPSVRRRVAEATTVLTRPAAPGMEEEEEEDRPVETKAREAAAETTLVDEGVAAHLLRELRELREAPAVSAAREPAPHQSQYCLLRQVRSGRTADLYLAHPDWPDGFSHDLAFKLLRADHAACPSRVAAFARQAQLLSSMHHENIVRVCDSGADGNSYYLVMDYLHGLDLRALAGKHPGGLPLGFVISIISNCARALHYARAKQGSAHTLYLGLSLSNVMVCTDGSIKVTELDQTAGPTRSLGQSELAYLAPELLHGEVSDARCEVFALGMMLYELATGAHPYWAPAAAPAFRTVRDRARHAALTSPTEHQPDLPAEFAELILTALARDPAQRYGDCLELEQALAEVAERLSLQVGEEVVRDFVQPLVRDGRVEETLEEPLSEAVLTFESASGDSSSITLIRRPVPTYHSGLRPEEDHSAPLRTGASAASSRSLAPLGGMPAPRTCARGTGPFPTRSAAIPERPERRNARRPGGRPVVVSSHRAPGAQRRRARQPRQLSSRSLMFLGSVAAFAAGLLIASLPW